jgi:hypothetical protein
MKKTYAKKETGTKWNGKKAWLLLIVVLLFLLVSSVNEMMARLDAHEHALKEVVTEADLDDWILEVDTEEY